jgi:tRNA (cytosine34-C5)-methyltransferase
MEALCRQGPSTGCIVANDTDAKRAYILVRRCAALSSACQSLLVTQHKAQKFPSLADTREGRYCQGQFDRIVCDVPCCGDGTLRKSPGLGHLPSPRAGRLRHARWASCVWDGTTDVWRRWHPGFAVGLHTLQVQIAMRGLALLRTGGLMVYSTCTFNPIEDEAVVAALLQKLVPPIFPRRRTAGGSGVEAWRRGPPKA